MMSISLPPLTFSPLIKQIRWGGRRLGDVLGKPIGDATDYAESWELVDHGDDQSLVTAPAPDALVGRSLHDLVVNETEALFGAGSTRAQFPLLIKFLDATDRLSVQVHPDDILAREFDPTENGKTEAWVILDATPGAQLFAGLQDGVTEADLRDALANETVESLLHVLEVRAGDCVFIPAGTVHAIGEGILLAEVQQSSDMTFRMYDWGRLGSDGSPRPLHIEESIRAIDWQRGPVHPVAPAKIDDIRERLVDCPFFTIDRLHLAHGNRDERTAEHARVLIGLDGRARVSDRQSQDATVTQNVGKGNTVLIPAGCEIAIAGPGVVLDIAVPH